MGIYVEMRDRWVSRECISWRFIFKVGSTPGSHRALSL
jgi:hypothetical protein